MPSPAPDATTDTSETLASYGALVGAYGAALTAATVLLARRGRLPERLSWSDLALAGIANHVLSRRITKDKVTRVVRAPFTEPEEPGAPGELNEVVRADSGPKRAIGELLSCPFCLSQWTAAGLVLGLAAAPRPTRFVASVLAVTGASDALQFVRTALEKEAEQ